MVSLRWCGVMLAAWALAACTLTADPATPTPANTPTPPGTPSVTIESPDNGAEFGVGDDVLVSATATDQGGVTSVQLFANERLVKTVSSESLAGDTTLPVVLDYVPSSVGEVQLEVIAYRGTLPSDPAQVTINVLEEDAPTPDTGNGGGSGPIIDPNDPTCRILTNVGLNYRTGPGTVYDRVGTFPAGTQAPIIGRVNNNSWWLVRVNNFTQAWVSADFTTEYGICSNVPIVPTPPTPTGTAPTPTNTPTLTPTPTNTLEPSATPTATNTPRPADLVVSSITGPRELTLADGEAVGSYTFQITNAGDSPVNGQFTNAVTIFPGGEAQELGIVGNLGAGESIVINRDLMFAGAGEYTLQATADSGDDIDEISNVNNTATIVVIVSTAE